MATVPPPIRVNRAPVLTLWAAVVAERLGYSKKSIAGKIPPALFFVVARGQDGPATSAGAGTNCMPSTDKKFRFLLVNAFSLPEGARYRMRPNTGPKEQSLMNHASVAPLLADVAWDLHPGVPATHGDWPVETREEFMLVGANRLPAVREACESGRYNAIVLLGGGDPGYPEAREIGRRHGIPVTSCGHAQMLVAAMLGQRFAIVDISEAHNMQMAHLVRQYGFAGSCASIRNINTPLPRPPYDQAVSVQEEERRAARGNGSVMLDDAVTAAVAAIEEDGAEVIIIGCSAAYWMQPLMQAQLAALGWEAPVLEGYRCAIEQAKMMVNLGVDASGLAFPGNHPRQWRRKKII